MGIVITYTRAFHTKRTDPYPVEVLKMWTWDAGKKVKTPSENGTDPKAFLLPSLSRDTSLIPQLSDMAEFL